MQGHTEIALAFYSLPRIFKDVQVDIASIQPAVQPRQPAFLKGKGYEQVQNCISWQGCFAAHIYTPLHCL